MGPCDEQGPHAAVHSQGHVNQAADSTSNGVDCGSLPCAWLYLKSISLMGRAGSEDAGLRLAGLEDFFEVPVTRGATRTQTCRRPAQASRATTPVKARWGSRLR